jgi:hypothetical protein
MVLFTFIITEPPPSVTETEIGTETDIEVPLTLIVSVTPMASGLAGVPLHFTVPGMRWPVPSSL